MSRLDTLMDAWLDGCIDADELDELQRALRDPAAADAFMLRCGTEVETRRQARDDGIPAAVDAALAGRPRIRRRHSRPRRTGRRIAIGALVAAVLLVAFVWTRTVSTHAPTPGEDAVGALVVDAGVIHVDGVASRERTPVRPGAQVQSGPQGSGHLAVAQVGDIHIEPATRCEVRGRRDYFVEAGALRVEALPQAAERPLSIHTPHAVCRVVGTRFRIAVTATSSNLTVEAGSVFWQPQGEPGATVPAGSSGFAGTPTGLRLDFGPDGAVQTGLAEPMRIVSDHELRFTATGLVVGREAFVRSENPPAPPRPQLLAALRGARQLELAARVRFHHRPPARQSLLTLMCQEAPIKADRYVPLYWQPDVDLADDAWHTVRCVLHRDGRIVTLIDDRVVAREQKTWPFDSWTPIIQLLLHSRDEDASEPLDIEYAWIAIQAR